MSVYYRKQLNYTTSTLMQANEAVDRLRNFKIRMETEEFPQGSPHDTVRQACAHAQTDFEKAMDDDLNISSALASLFELVRSINTMADNNELTMEDARLVLSYLQKFDKVLGIIFWKDTVLLDSEITQLIEARNQARKDKNYHKADEIRQLLSNKGIVLEDTKTGTRWKKI